MKVNGQLENAQLEQIAGTSTTPASTGRIYMDVTAPTAAVPTVYNGAAWKQLAFVSTDTLVSQNSAKAVTVDWSTGLNQRVVLTDNALISFSNPQSDKIHTLVVQQAVNVSGASEPTYQYKLNMTDQDCGAGVYQPNGVIPSARNFVYRWFYKASIRTGYANVASNTMTPGVAIATLATGIDIHPKGLTVLMGRTGSPFATALDLYDEPSQNASVYNTSPVTPATLAAQAVGVVFHPSGKFAFFASGTTPFIQGFPTDRGVGVGTAIVNPATLPTGAAKCIAMHPSGYFVGVGHTTTPFMSIYPITAAGVVGVKLTDPSPVPAAQVNSLAFSPMGDFLAAASQTTPFLQVWPFTGTTPTGTIGSVAANPGTLPAGGPAGALGKGVAWRPQGDYIAMAMTTTPYLYVVPFNRSTGAYGTALTVTALSGAAQCVQWTPDGQYLLVGTGTSPFLYVYDFSAFTLSAVTLDGSNPGQNVNDIAIAKNGEYALLALNGGTFTVGYTLPQKTKNYLRLN